MRYERDAILTCTACGVEGPHELLYLSGQLRGSRCLTCGETGSYSGHIYAEFARDLAARTTMLPLRLAGEVIRHPLAVPKWPVKALGKPFGLVAELVRVNSFEKGRHHAPPGDGPVAAHSPRT